MGFHNIAAGDGVGIMLTGMAIVFVGLTLITFYIAGIPKLFETLSKAKGKTTSIKRPLAAQRQTSEVPVISSDSAMMTAIAAVIQLELEQQRTFDDQRITIERSSSQQIWAAAGKMRTLSTRM